MTHGSDAASASTDAIPDVVRVLADRLSPILGERLVGLYLGGSTGISALQLAEAPGAAHDGAPAERGPAPTGPGRHVGLVSLEQRVVDRQLRANRDVPPGHQRVLAAHPDVRIARVIDEVAPVVA